MHTPDELFDAVGQVASFHDAMFEAFGKSLSTHELRDIFNSLPNHVQAVAVEWGLNDTVFRDMAYEHVTKVV